MESFARGWRKRFLKRALLSLALAGCSHAFTVSGGAVAAPLPADTGWTASSPVMIGGVPVAYETRRAAYPVIGRPEPALAHHMHEKAEQENLPAAGSKAGAGEALDPINTSAIVRSVFGSYAIPMRNFPVAGRWAKVFRGIEACAAGGSCAGEAAAFAAVTKGLERSSFLEKVRAVNLRVNRAVSYRNDNSVYGRFDHWGSPGETLSRRSGDCEDFVILKMAALMKAGIPARSMSLVVLQIRGKDVFHAVLSVSTSSGAFILDNVGDSVLSDTAIRDYTPLYSLSVDRAWIHGTKATGTAVARNETRFGAIAPGEGPR